MQIKHAKDCQTEIWDIARSLANSAIDGYKESLYDRQYIWHRPSKDPTAIYHEVGDVCVATNMGGSYQLSYSECIPRNRTSDQLTTWIHDRIISLPII